MKPWKTYKCPKCGATQKAREGQEVFHRCPQVASKDALPVLFKEVEEDE